MLVLKFDYWNAPEQKGLFASKIKPHRPVGLIINILFTGKN